MKRSTGLPLIPAKKSVLSHCKLSVDRSDDGHNGVCIMANVPTIFDESPLNIFDPFDVFSGFKFPDPSTTVLARTLTA